ncbi:MFS transporter [Rhodoplanes sp. TEM]|uniref:MFS transporter n=1 Tax=Rhodoplanes tepidamans TaxID=200616 RepID=A0ABT5J994_RHOTP|nr:MULTISPECIES: MFS transporter [Rhodoplanes]MDC7785630.1 MFS transporter [Rhodoplanes tepidamans]MDC7985731.1 MFS transporter [Rhodoplanes sp. TEM]MDQ0354804.1 MFS family permease [Rhodoplanes tepidamans]
MTEQTSRPAAAAGGRTIVGGGTAAVAALVATLGATYVVSQFLRNGIAVLAPTLSAELGLSASDLALVSSVFFFVFVAMQIPLGVAIDRFGPKRIMLVFAVLVVGSTLLFAAATDAAEVFAARALMGIGTSCYLMAPLAYYARSFPPERFATLAGLQLGVGTLGSLLATAPLALAAAAVGWRTAFAATAVLMGLVGLLVAVLMREPAAEPEARHETLAEGLRGVAEAWRQPDAPRLFVMNLTAYASYALVVGLWGGPYLTHAYGHDLTARGALLFVPALTQAAGMIVWGAADRVFGGYRIPTLLGATATALLLLLLAVAGTLPPAGLWAWLAAFGFCSAFLPVVIAHGRALFPRRLVGRGMTLMNMGTMGGGFLSQLLGGLLINQFAAPGGVYPVDAYRAVFFAQFVFCVLGMLVYRAVRDPLR